MRSAGCANLWFPSVKKACSPWCQHDKLWSNHVLGGEFLHPAAKLSPAGHGFPKIAARWEHRLCRLPSRCRKSTSVLSLTFI
jgi:hypothetical protein